MKKVITMILLCLTAMCCAVGLSACGGGKGSGGSSVGGGGGGEGGWYFTPDEQAGEVRASFFGGAYNGENLEVPAEYEGDPVTIVAIDITNHIPKITLPACVKRVEMDITAADEVYYQGTLTDWCGMESFYVDSSDASGEPAIFYIDNQKIEGELQIPEGVTSLGAGIFSGKMFNITSVTLPSTLTSIYGSVFDSSPNLKKIVTPAFEFNVIGNSGNGSQKVSLLGLIKDYNSEEQTQIEEVIVTGAVSEVPDNAFGAFHELKKVTLPDTIVNIGYCAFTVPFITDQSPKLTTVNMPTSLQTIEEGAFSGCSSLTGIDFPASLKTIGHGAFENCSSLTSIDLSNVQQVGNSAFSGCSGLTSIKFPAEIHSIDGGEPWFLPEQVAEGCVMESAGYIPDLNSYLKGVTKFKLPASIAEVPEYFLPSGCGITEIELPDGVQKIGDYAFSGLSELTKITIPDTVTEIGTCAFNGCSSLTTINLPDGLQVIEISTFSDCSSLAEVKLPDSLQTIKGSAFSGCSSLATINWPDGLQTIEGGAFNGCAFTSVTIPAVIDDLDAFSYCANLSEVVINGDIISLAGFDNCPNLNSVKFMGKVETIGYAAFEGCSSLTDFDFPEGLQVIEGSAFSDCGLRSVVIPEGVTEVASYAFINCPLEYIKLPSTLTSPGYIVGYNDSSDVTKDLVIETGVMEFTTDRGSGYTIAGYLPKTFKKFIINGVEEIPGHLLNGSFSISEIELTDGVQKIGEYAFSELSALTEITIPDTVTEIGDCAFNCCSSLGAVNLPEGLQIIGEYAFGGCSSLTEVKLPASLQTIEEGAFSGCSSLAGVDLPADLRTIGASAFLGCNLSEIDIPDGTTTIGQQAFAYNDNLQTVIVPDSLTDVGINVFAETPAFDNCYQQGVACYFGNALNPCALLVAIRGDAPDDLTFTIDENTKAVCDDVFYYSWVEKLIIPDSITTLKINLERCSFLRDIVFGENYDPTQITVINCDSFDGYLVGNVRVKGTVVTEIKEGAVSAIIPDTVTEIDRNAFSNASTLKYIFIPSSVTVIPDDAFNSLSKDAYIIYAGDGVDFNAIRNHYDNDDKKLRVYCSPAYECTRDGWVYKDVNSDGSRIQLSFYLGDVDADGNVTVPDFSGKHHEVIIGDINLAGSGIYSMFLSRSDVRKMTISKAGTSESSWDNYPYTEVQPFAFYGCQNLVEMHLGQDVIGLRIYYETVLHSNLERITLANDLYYQKSYYLYNNSSVDAGLSRATFTSAEEMVSVIKNLQQNMTLVVGNVL